ncbi:MAG: hypothetical protein KME12_25710 [Trichocoleus desertorum ATA4-8-CV12]|jgi:hypothetical protein|nr:hypothetical protein [Trichocoleus desertorum ATA4-8-CV12]
MGGKYPNSSAPLDERSRFAKYDYLVPLNTGDRSSSGNGTVWLPGLKGSLLIQQIVEMERLGILELLRPGRELRNSDADLIQLKERLTANEWQTKALFDLKINPN